MEISIRKGEKFCLLSSSEPAIKYQLLNNKKYAIF